MQLPFIYFFVFTYLLLGMVFATVGRCNMLKKCKLGAVCCVFYTVSLVLAWPCASALNRLFIKIHILTA